MQHLTSINLANNSFSIFPDKLTEIATLERINLEGNSITSNYNIFTLQVAYSYGFVWAQVYSLFFFVLQKYLWRRCPTCRLWSGWTWSQTLWTQTLSLLCNLPTILKQNPKICHIIFTHIWTACGVPFKYFTWMLWCAWGTGNNTWRWTEHITMGLQETRKHRCEIKDGICLDWVYQSCWWPHYAASTLFSLYELQRAGVEITPSLYTIWYVFVSIET